MDKAVKRVLEKEAIKLYGINLKQDCSIKFEDMTLSLIYDKDEPKEEKVKETVTKKSKGKGRGKSKKK